MTDNMLSLMKQIYKELSDRDPLKKLGIPFEHVCVIPPAMESPLAELAKREIPNTDRVPRLRLVELVTGRETYVMNDAAPDRVEYMSKEELYRRFAAEFQRRLEMIQVNLPGDAL